MWNKRKIYNIAAVILSLLIVMNLGVICAGAADNQTFIGNVYQKETGTLEIICTIPGETGTAENFTVLLGDVALPVSSVTTAGEEDIPRTVYCLVDISGSMKGRMEQAKDVLYAIAGTLNENDNFVIGRMGNEITDSAYLTDPEEIRTQIDGLQYTGEDTNFYSGLLHAIRFLQQGSEVREMPVLVIVSDGCDDNGNGVTEEEADTAARQADIPIYTAAVILNSSDYEGAKKLGSFARNSAGGIHLPEAEANSSVPSSMTGEEMGNAIAGAMDSAFHVRASLDGVEKSGKDTYVLSVAFRGADGNTCEDSREIKASDLTLADPEETAAPEPTAEPEPKKQEDPDDPDVPSSLLIIAGAAGFLIAGLIVLLLWNRSRKIKEDERKRLEEEQRAREEQQRREAEARRREAELRAHRAAQEEQRRREAEQRRSREQEALSRRPKLRVRFTALGSRNLVFYLDLIQGYEMSVGRNETAQLVLNPDDSRLSGSHFVMLWDGKKVYVWDGGSTNGTAVNGVIIKPLGKVQLRPGDSLGAGSYEYRVYWEE